MKSQWLDTLYQIIHDYPKQIATFWIILSIVCSYWSFQLTDYTLFQFEPPKNYPSAIALKKLHHYFPNKSALSIELIVLEKHSDLYSSIINNQTETVYTKLKNELMDQPLVKSLSSYFDYATSKSSTQPNKAMDDLIKHKFVNKKEDMMLAIITLDTAGISTNTLSKVMDDIDRKIKHVEAQKYSKDVSIKMTGYTTMFQSFLKTVKSDISGRDLIILPFVFGFMIYVLGSWKLVILPILCLLQSIIISFTFFLPFAKYKVLTVSPLTPTIMLFMIMAISIDYSLFLLSKFASNCRNGRNVEESVKNMVHFSGHVCILSAIVLIMCYLGLSLFPVAGMNTIGYGTSIAIIFCATINVTFSASVLLIFPKFFSDFSGCCTKNKDSPQNIDYRLTGTEEITAVEMETETFQETTSDSETSSDTENETLNEDSDDKSVSIQSQRLSFHQNEIMESRDNIYFGMAQLVTKSPYNIIIPLILYLTMIPVIIIGFLRYDPSLDDLMNFPSNSEPVNVYKQVVNNFNPGILNPISVVAINHDRNHIDPNQHYDIWSLSYFKNLCDLGNVLIKDDTYQPTELMSIAFIPYNDNLVCMGSTKETLINYKNAMEKGVIPPWITKIFPAFTSELFQQFYLSYFHHSVNHEASIFNIEPNFNPYVQSDLAEELRNLIHKKASNYGNNIELHVNSQSYWKLDGIKDLYGRIPGGLSIIIVVIFSFVGFMYGVYFLPFRLFLCIVIPILFVYGITSLIFEDEGIYWLLPPMTMTVLIGLALDYELFLFSRIYDFRLNGFTNRASIILGVSLSGPIITSAGIVMSLAFLGLLLQDITASKQCGTIYVLGVIIDTFIIRPFLVPSLLSLTFNSKGKDKWNWYPVQMPTNDLKNEYGEIQ